MGMGIREYARHRKAQGLPGGTHRAVQKALAQGRIVAGPDGRIECVDADLRWIGATNPALQRGAVVEMPAPAVCAPVLPLLDGVVETAPAALSPGIDWRAGGWDGPMPPAPPLAERLAASAASAGANVVDLSLYQRSKAEREWAESQMALDALAKSRAQLIDVGEAKKTFAAVGRMYAQGREAVPQQLAPQLVGLKDLGEIERRVRAALREVDDRILSEIRSQYSGMASCGEKEGNQTCKPESKLKE